MISSQVNTIGKRPIARDINNTKLVLQAEFGIARAADKDNRLLTKGIGECIAVPIMAPDLQVAGLAHFDVMTMVPESFARVIMPQFRQRGEALLKAQMIGGNGSDESEKLVRDIRDLLVSNEIEITGMDIGNIERQAGLIVDATKMQVFDVEQASLIFDNEEYWQREEAAIQYIIANSQRLIHLVV